MNWNATGRPKVAEAKPYPMLSTRSARLAATLLLALFFGWTVRGCRKGKATTYSPQSPTMAAPPREALPSRFPDE